MELRTCAPSVLWRQPRRPGQVVDRQQHEISFHDQHLARVADQAPRRSRLVAAALIGLGLDWHRLSRRAVAVATVQPVGELLIA
jgi:hypothetical protein